MVGMGEVEVMQFKYSLLFQDTGVSFVQRVVFDFTFNIWELWFYWASTDIIFRFLEFCILVLGFGVFFVTFFFFSLF